MTAALADRRCGPCGGGVLPYTREQALAALKQIDPVWQLSEDGRYIERLFRCKDYYRVMSLVNAIAHIAHSEDHHPDLKVSYQSCLVRYTTHEIKGLSDNDFICAAKIDRL
jgi:4a-hydroxytetrahydrobiopterin dehydratase